LLPAILRPMSPANVLESSDRPMGRLRDQPLLPLPSASAVAPAGSLSIAIQTDLPLTHDGHESSERRYVRGVLGRYLWLPGTPGWASRHDRRLAQVLFERGVALLCVEAALLLGAARRALREPWLAPLPRVRSLYYHAGSRIMPGERPGGR
jgi:hypothetical protein